MGRLFWKIFLWFWVTLLLIGITVSFGTAIYLNNSDEYRRPDISERFVNERIDRVKANIAYRGLDSVKRMVKPSRRAPFKITILLLDDSGKDVFGRSFPPNATNKQSNGSVTAPDGNQYKLLSSYYVEPPPSSMSLLLRPLKRNEGVFVVWLGIAILLSALVCGWLALYLTKPIRSLQSAAKKLAEGHLETRVSPLIGNRKDEIADLGNDFDMMAGRLQSLLNNQKQLLSDVSHELRSPLARLQVALELARKKVGSNEASAELQRIERETNRLDDLVGQSLTLSRLDAGAAYPKEDYIDLGSLLSDIVKDCNYEANVLQKAVNLDYSQSWTLQANAELFRRALENVVRNAIHYTEQNTSVDVSMRKTDHTGDNSSAVVIKICDHGPGVPEDKLETLFDPFVRLSSARDRDSGGYGLGLAIAKRAVEFHNGEIIAYNAKNNGLCIEIRLPEVSADL